MFYDHWENTQLVFENIYFLAVQFTYIIKLCNELWNYDKVRVRKTLWVYLLTDSFDYYFNETIYYGQIRYLYEAMENHWNVFASEFEMCILKDSSILSRKCTIIYSSEYIQRIYR